MDLPPSLDSVVTQQTLTTMLGVLALALGLVLSFNQGNPIITGFMFLFTALLVFVLVMQMRTSLREAKYT